MGWKRTNVQTSVEQAAEVTEGLPLFKPEAGQGGRYGDNWIRVLPPRDDADTDSFFKWMAVHFIGKSPVICLRKMYDEACPACAQAQSGNDRKGPRWYAVMNVVVLNDEGDPKEDLVRIWPAPRTVLDDLMGEITKLPADQQDITDPETGRPVLVRRKGTGQTDTRYQIALAQGPFSFEATHLLDTMHDLSASYELVDAEKMLALLTGGSDPFEGSGNGGRPRLQAARPIDDDVVEGEVVPEAGEEAPAPAPKPAVKEEEAQAKAALRAKLRKATAAAE
jgi:hypothetical protein